ncbi:MAG: hypothetical protein AABX11_03840 [Nanoarchaeota archaeon]
MENYEYYFIIVFLMGIILMVFIPYSTVGRAIGTAEGTLNVTIETTTSLNFTVNLVNFGSGSVALGHSNATLDTLGNVIDGNWTPVTDGFTLENIGNTNLSVYIKSDSDADIFLGGTNPAYYYMMSNLELNSCSNESLPFSSWTSVNTTGYGDKVCNEFQPVLTNNSLRLDLKLVIPSDALLGERTDTFTATGISS